MTSLDPDRVERAAAAILGQMRADIGRMGDWAIEPERNREAFRRAARAALAAADGGQAAAPAEAALLPGASGPFAPPAVGQPPSAPEGVLALLRKAYEAAAGADDFASGLAADTRFEINGALAYLARAEALVLRDLDQAAKP